MFTGQTLSSYTWNNNTYYGLNGFYLGTYDGNNFGPTTNGTFQNWQLQTGLDSTSTYTPDATTGTWTYIQPNQYEQKRANITIYNWNLRRKRSGGFVEHFCKCERPVCDSGRAEFLRAGRGGRAVLTSGTVSIPMTGLTKAAAIGFTAGAHSTAIRNLCGHARILSSAMLVFPLTSTLY